MLITFFRKTKGQETTEVFLPHTKMPQIKVKKVTAFITARGNSAFSITSWTNFPLNHMHQTKPTDGVWMSCKRKGSYIWFSLITIIPSCSHFHKIKAGKVLFGNDVNERGWELSCREVEAIYEIGLLHVISYAFNVLLCLWEELPIKYFLAATEKNKKKIIPQSLGLGNDVFASLFGKLYKKISNTCFFSLSISPLSICMCVCVYIHVCICLYLCICPHKYILYINYYILIICICSFYYMIIWKSFLVLGFTDHHIRNKQIFSQIVLHYCNNSKSPQGSSVYQTVKSTTFEPLDSTTSCLNL